MTRTLPGYTEQRLLGDGDSGYVMLAQQDDTGTLVAIKYLSEALLVNQEFRTRFHRVAELLAALASPHIARLYQYVEAGDGAAIVMELVDGISLRELIVRAGPLEPEEALLVLKGSLLGLAAAHEGGVLHQDYKPGNVLVEATGHTKLVDFGVYAHSWVTRHVSTTSYYMAPEQWRGVEICPATDLYAATAAFFECLTGYKPFPGANRGMLALRHQHAPVPLERVPEAVRDLVSRGLAKDPSERPETAAEFVEELEKAAMAAYGAEWEEQGGRRLADRMIVTPPILLPSGVNHPGLSGKLTF